MPGAADGFKAALHEHTKSNKYDEAPAWDVQNDQEVVGKNTSKTLTLDWILQKIKDRYQQEAELIVHVLTCRGVVISATDYRQ